MDCETMLNAIISATKTDPELVVLYDKTLDYLRMYLLVKRRQKGCDGLGELNNLKDELNEAFYEIVDYCRGKHIPPEVFSCDLDLMIEELLKADLVSL